MARHQRGSWVCFTDRWSARSHRDFAPPVCPKCREPMVWARHQPVPPRKDTAGWEALAEYIKRMERWERRNRTASGA